MDRVGRLVLVSCEAFDNHPHGIPGGFATLSVRVPGGVSLMRRALLARPEIRRDYRKYAGDTRRGKRALLAATGALHTSTGRS